MDICSLMFGKMFGAFANSMKEQHSTNEKQLSCIVGRKVWIVSRGPYNHASADMLGRIVQHI